MPLQGASYDVPSESGEIVVAGRDSRRAAERVGRHGQLWRVASLARRASGASSRPSRPRPLSPLSESGEFVPAARPLALAAAASRASLWPPRATLAASVCAGRGGRKASRSVDRAGGESEAVAAAFASGGVEWGESVGCNTPFVFPSAPEGGRGEFVRVGGTCRGLARAVECGNERKPE